MKFVLVMMLVLGSASAMARNGTNDFNKDFNKALIDDVNKDIKAGNDQNLQKDNSPMRGPASVVDGAEDSEPVFKEDQKFNTKEKVNGLPKW